MHVTAKRFEDRAQAGRQLAERLQAYAGRDDVLALNPTRGGAAAAAGLAHALDVPLEVLLVRRPLEALVGATVRDLDREARSYRGGRPPPDVAGRWRCVT